MYKILIVEDTLAIREEIPALIISDILMPDLNGFEMFEKHIHPKVLQLYPDANLR